jgi:hypothetical protein
MKPTPCCVIIPGVVSVSAEISLMPDETKASSDSAEIDSGTAVKASDRRCAVTMISSPLL